MPIVNPTFIWWDAVVHGMTEYVVFGGVVKRCGLV